MSNFSITIYDECPVCEMPMNPMHEKNSDCSAVKLCGCDATRCGCGGGDKNWYWGALNAELVIGFYTKEYMENNFEDWGAFEKLIDER